MIVSKLIGGLGNQMFQYACGRAVALRTGQEFKLDIAGYENQNPLDTKRDYELGIFKISSQFSTSTECQMLKGRNGGILEISAKIHFPLLSRYIFKDKNTYFFENIQQKFEDRILNLSGNAYLDGWWQSEKYFMDFKDQIIKDFTFKDKILSEYKKYLEDIKNSFGTLFDNLHIGHKATNTHLF